MAPAGAQGSSAGQSGFPQSWHPCLPAARGSCEGGTGTASAPSHRASRADLCRAGTPGRLASMSSQLAAGSRERPTLGIRRLPTRGVKGPPGEPGRSGIQSKEKDGCHGGRLAPVKGAKVGPWWALAHRAGLGAEGQDSRWTKECQASSHRSAHQARGSFVVSRGRH